MRGRLIEKMTLGGRLKDVHQWAVPGWVGNIAGHRSAVGERSLIAGVTEQQEARMSERLVIRIEELRPGKRQDTDHSGLGRPL